MAAQDDVTGPCLYIPYKVGRRGMTKCSATSRPLTRLDDDSGNPTFSHTTRRLENIRFLETQTTNINGGRRVWRVQTGLRERRSLFTFGSDMSADFIFFSPGQLQRNRNGSADEERVEEIGENERRWAPGKFVECREALE